MSQVRNMFLKHFFSIMMKPSTLIFSAVPINNLIDDINPSKIYTPLDQQSNLDNESLNFKSK